MDYPGPDSSQMWIEKGWEVMETSYRKGNSHRVKGGDASQSGSKGGWRTWRSCTLPSLLIFTTGLYKPLESNSKSSSKVTLNLIYSTILKGDSRWQSSDAALGQGDFSLSCLMVTPLQIKSSCSFVQTVLSQVLALLTAGLLYPEVSSLHLSTLILLNWVLQVEWAMGKTQELFVAGLNCHCLWRLWELQRVYCRCWVVRPPVQKDLLEEWLMKHPCIPVGLRRAWEGSSKIPGICQVDGETQRNCSKAL